MVTEAELRRMVEAVSDAYGGSKITAVNKVMNVLQDSLTALREKDAMERNLNDQIDAKVDLQVRVRELERELQQRPPQGWSIPNETDPNAPFQPIWKPNPNPNTVFPNYPPGVRSWNTVDGAVPVRSGIDDPWPEDGMRAD